MTPKLLALLTASLLTACGSGGPPPADWKMNAVSHMDHAQQRWLEGDTKAAELAQQKVRKEIAKSARLDLLARVELAQCAAHVAALDFSPCTAYLPLAQDASPADQAYARFLEGNWQGLDAKLLPGHYQALVGAKDESAAQKAAAEIKEPLARLISLALLLKQTRLRPEGFAGAVETSSERGWKRPLLAWLEVSLQRAKMAGDKNAVEQIARRTKLLLTIPTNQ